MQNLAFLTRTFGILALVVSLSVFNTGCGEDDDPVNAVENNEHENNEHENNDPTNNDPTNNDPANNDPANNDPANNDNNHQEDVIEIEGTWTSSFGGNETITSEDWNGSEIHLFDNEERFAITQNADDDEYNPSAYNKLVWTPIENDAFFYCWVDFGLETIDEALNTENVADDSDPENSGCGGFSWTQLTRE